MLLGPKVSRVTKVIPATGVRKARKVLLDPKARKVYRVPRATKVTKATKGIPATEAQPVLGVLPDHRDLLEQGAPKGQAAPTKGLVRFGLMTLGEAVFAMGPSCS